MEDEEATEKEPGALKTLGNSVTLPAQTFLRRDKLLFLKSGVFANVVLGFCHSFPINKKFL